MENMENNEQWKSDGNCNKCRRKNYCSKSCTLHTRIEKYRMKVYIAGTMNEMTGGVMEKQIYETVFKTL